MAILTPGGPLVLDVWLTLDGHSHADVFTELINGVLEAGDGDDDGHSTWKELADNKEFAARSAAVNSADDGRQAKMWTERFDQLRDGRVQPGEAAAWLGRESGRRASAFAVRSTRSYFPNVRATSRLWQLLDSDDDGSLSTDELKRLPTELLAFDSDDDRTIVADELIALKEQLAARSGGTMPIGQADSRQAAIRLQPPGDAARLQNLLIDLYSPRRNIGPASFPDFGRLFDELDANGDDRLEQDELIKILNVGPHITLSIDFDQRDASHEAMAALRLLDRAAEIAVLGHPANDRAVVSLPGCRLIVTAHDMASPQDSAQLGQRSHIRLMVHDECDPLFEELDSNSDGRLGEREIDSSVDHLAQLDNNEDGQISSNELRPTMIVAFLRAEPLGEQSFHRPESAFASVVGNNAPSWFVSADFNADGDVSRREFLGSADQFDKRDHDGDRYISAAEAAEREAN